MWLDREDFYKVGPDVAQTSEFSIALTFSDLNEANVRTILRKATAPGGVEDDKASEESARDSAA